MTLDNVQAVQTWLLFFCVSPSLQSTAVWKSDSSMQHYNEWSRSWPHSSRREISVVLYTEYDSSLRHSGTAHVNERSHSFTCHRHVYPRMEWASFGSFRASPHWPVLIARPVVDRVTLAAAAVTVGDGVCIQAMVTALQLLHQCSREDAERTFAGGVCWTEEEFETKWQQAVRSSARAKRHSF